MAFRFTWPEFDASFTERARVELENALNRGTKPSNICDRIRVMRLHMGSQPPQLDILEIGELTEERFRGIFKFTYTGDAHVVLQTRVQANPLSLETDDDKLCGWMRSAMVAADAPLIVPLELTISQFKIRGIFVLIVSLRRGVTVSFKNEPLESVLVNSTFDSVPAIRTHLQREIQTRLSHLFKEEIPLLVHQMAMDPLERVAERIPEAFRTVPAPAGSFQRRRCDSWTGTASPSAPSRANSPVGGFAADLYKEPSRAFDEIYYYRRRHIIHRAASRLASCDPLAEPAIAEMQALCQMPSLVEDIMNLAGRIPLFGEQVKECLERLLFPSGRSSASCLETLRGVGEIVSLVEPLGASTLRHPLIFKARRMAVTDGYNESQEHLSLHDPEEFRSLDTVALQGPLPLRVENALRPSGPSFGILALQRSVRRGALASKLLMLRSLYENPSPVMGPASALTVHRAHPPSAGRSRSRSPLPNLK